jgi:GMP synthase (glutamine-hydrolysing)
MGSDQSSVLVVDFGAQYAQLIARRIRELGVKSELTYPEKLLVDIKAINPVGIIFSGGPDSVYSPGSPRVDHNVYSQNIPILGICYGAQLIAQDLGGEVSETNSKEFGRSEVTVLDDSLLLKNLQTTESFWMSHSDSISKPPEGAEVIATSGGSPVCAFQDKQKRIFGVQFHPEVIHSENGLEVLKNFVFDICQATRNWTTSSILGDLIEGVKQQVKDEKAICALSGGIDSAVAAGVVSRAIGSNLTAVFIDTGLLRQNEAEEVEKAFKGELGVNLIKVDASKKFLSALAGVTNPEQKRKIIGGLFVEVLEEVAQSIGDVKYLVQGTLYPDVVESGNGKSGLIKTHHNVGGLPEKMKLKLVEPLRELFKDEVRKLGLELGLPEDLVYRQPFPGPGLAVRIVGEVTERRLEILRKADAIISDEIRRARLHRKLWQYFAVLLAVKTVGVQGDLRSYSYPIVIRTVEAQDAMTADWARLPYDLVERISNRITSEVKEVNRVVLDVTSKPPGTIEWE